MKKLTDSFKLTLKFTVKKSACLEEAGVAGNSSYSNTMTVGGNTTHNQTVTLACETNYWTTDNANCSCEATVTDSIFTCNSNYSPTCSPSKNRVPYAMLYHATISIL